jgi:hypothetical protein
MSLKFGYTLLVPFYDIAACLWRWSWDSESSPDSLRGRVHEAIGTRSARAAPASSSSHDSGFMTSTRL